MKRKISNIIEMNIGLEVKKMLAALKSQKEEAAKPVKAPAKEAATKVKKTVAPKKKTARKKTVKEVAASIVLPVTTIQEEKK